MNVNEIFGGDNQVVSSPVFEGLETLGFSGLDIAKIACVSPPTISKWRNGYMFAPNELIVLLTLVLASRLLDISEQGEYVAMPSHRCMYPISDLESAQQDLEAQEKVNYNLPSSTVRSGIIRFRYWWQTQQRLKITQMRMSVGQVNQFLSAN